MNDILFILLIISIIMSVKYYTFDIPQKDKKLYQLNGFLDDLDHLLDNKVITRDSPEYRLMNILIKHQYFLVSNGVTFKFIIGSLLYKMNNKKSKRSSKSSKTIIKIKENEQLHELYKQLDEFYSKNIFPTYKRKLLVIKIILISLLPIVYLMEMIHSRTDKFKDIDLNKLKSTRSYDLNPSLEFLGYIDPSKNYI